MNINNLVVVVGGVETWKTEKNAYFKGIKPCFSMLNVM